MYKHKDSYLKKKQSNVKQASSQKINEKYDENDVDDGESKLKNKLLKML